MHRFLLIILLPLWICAAGSTLLEAQSLQNRETIEEVPKFAVDVPLVTMDVTVLPAASHNLGADDFNVWDNGVAQQVTYFSRDLTPLSIAVVVDRSLSILNYLPLLQKAALSALGRLKPEDRVALFTFEAEVLKLKDLTVDHDLVARIVGSLVLGSVGRGRGTDIYRTLYDVAHYLKLTAPQNRRAIILISDNCHTVSSGIDKEDAYAEVMESGATLYSIQTPGRNPTRGRSSTSLVKRLAEETGGELFNVNAPTSLQEGLEKAINNLRLQYTLGFNLSNPGKESSFHKLTVKLVSEDRCSGCRLLTRKGYYSGISASPPSTNTLLLSNARFTKRSREVLDGLRYLFDMAISVDFNLPDIPIITRTSEQEDSGGKHQIKVDLRLDFSHVGFQTVGDRYRFRLYAAIFAPGNGDEEYSGWIEKSQVLEGTLKEETYRQLLREGLLLSLTIPKVGQKEILKIVAYDELTGTVGSRTINTP